jgi:hypothetical protein
MPLTHDQARRILAQAKAANACAGQYRAAAHALKRKDLEGFERIFRAIHVRLAKKGIDYKLTDGLAEVFYPTGALRYRCALKNGKREGRLEEFYRCGALNFRGTCKNGELHGLAQGFYPDGTPRFRGTYKNGVQQ